MAVMVYNEQYGDITVAQQAAYRKYNVSPSDHDDLVQTYGEDAHAEITAAVKTYVQGRSFSSYMMHEAHRDAAYGY